METLDETDEGFWGGFLRVTNCQMTTTDSFVVIFSSSRERTRFTFLQDVSLIIPSEYKGG